eukprot:g5477.t1
MAAAQGNASAPLNALPYLAGGPRSFSAEIVAYSFCPTMDLVAVATADGSLHVHRSMTKNFQRLFTATEADDRAVSTLAWSPCGKVLAVGYDDGSVLPYDVESGETHPMPSCHAPHTESIMALCWARQLGEGEVVTAAGPRSMAAGGGHGAAGAEGTDADARLALLDRLYVHFEDRASRFMATPSPLREAETFSQWKSGGARARWPQVAAGGESGSGALDVLVSGDNGGVVTLSALGFFPIGRVSLSGAVDLTEDSIPRVSHVCLSADLSTLSVVLVTERQRRRGAAGRATAGVGGRGGGTGSGSDDDSASVDEEGHADGYGHEDSEVRRRHHLVTVDTSLLWDRRHELLQVATQCGHIGGLLSHVGQAIGDMEKRWTDAVSALKSQVDTLRKLLDTHGRTAEPRAELFTLFTTGTPSPAVVQFFTQKLTEQGLGRLQKTLDTACSELEAFLVQHVQLATENVVFRLTELIGLARWERRFRPVGLTPPVLAALTAGAEALMVKAEEMLVDVRETRVKFGALFVWLVRVAHRMAGENRGPATRDMRMVDVERVAALLQVN